MEFFKTPKIVGQNLAVTLWGWWWHQEQKICTQLICFPTDESMERRNPKVNKSELRECRWGMRASQKPSPCVTGDIQATRMTCFNSHTGKAHNCNKPQNSIGWDLFPLCLPPRLQCSGFICISLFVVSTFHADFWPDFAPPSGNTKDSPKGRCPYAKE